MSTKINHKDYFLAEACKNTFILFDCLAMSSVDEQFLCFVHECLVKENRDDALILIDKKIDQNTLHAKLLVLGLDGEMGEFCGNGARACAAFLFSYYPKCATFYLISKWGAHQLLRNEKYIYSIQLPMVRFTIENTKFIAQPGLFQKKTNTSFLFLNGLRLFYVEAIEPHLVVNADLDDEELIKIGDYLNSCRDLFPYGININACQQINEVTLKVTTYERGVRRLTFSCGTGASACVALCFPRKKGTINALTPGGPLEIILKSNGIELKGPALVYDRY